MKLITTGHGRPMYDALTAAVAAAKHDDPLTPVTLIVPSELIGVTARRRLACGPKGGKPGIAGLSVMALRRLAEQLAGPTLAAAGRRPLTDPILAVAVRAVLATDAGTFIPVAAHRGTVQVIASAYRELRSLPESLVSQLEAHRR